jgi:hypothetical protein
MAGGCGSTRILEIFGGVALFLAIIGLYAINAYNVARRTREIGIRMALGAGASSRLRMILGECLRVIAWVPVSGCCWRSESAGCFQLLI